MDVRGHLIKIERLMRQRAKLNRFRDCEMWYWATLNAGVHAINAALHAIGATRDGPWFAHNVPVYHVAGPRKRGWRAAIRPLGDIEHVDSDEMEALIPRSLNRARRALRKMEYLREPILRGDAKPSAERLDRIERLFKECLVVSSRAILRSRRPAR